MGYSTLVTVLLISLGTICNRVTTESNQCYPEPEPVNYNVETTSHFESNILYILTDIYNEVKAGNTTQKVLDDKLRLTQIKLDRLHQSWEQYYFRADPAFLVKRFLAIDTLHQIEAVRRTVKTARSNSSRLEPWNKMIKDKLQVFPKFISQVVELNNVGKQRYNGCDSWRHVLQNDWQRFVCKQNGFDVDRLKQTFQVLKETITQLRTRSTTATEDEETQLANQARLERLETMFDEYQKWVEKGERPPYGSPQCLKTQFVPLAIQITSQVQRLKYSFIMDYTLYLYISGRDLRINDFLAQAELYTEDFAQEMKALAPANLTARYLSLVPKTQLDALIEFMMKARTRIEFYAQQPKEYFKLPQAFGELPFETVMAESENNVERKGIERAHQCQMWTEVLEEQWKRFKANPTGNATNTAALRDTFQALKQTALDTKEVAVKLAEKLPNDNSRYLDAETELKILTMEKVNEKLAGFFDEYLKEMNKNTVATSS